MLSYSFSKSSLVLFLSLFKVLRRNSRKLRLDVVGAVVVVVVVVKVVVVVVEVFVRVPRSDVESTLVVDVIAFAFSQ